MRCPLCFFDNVRGNRGSCDDVWGCCLQVKEDGGTEKLKLKDLSGVKKLKLIGVGGFGQVFFVIHPA